jgi:Flp pilus assembly CpaF family ATPase
MGDWRMQLRLLIKRGGLTPSQADRLWDVIGTMTENQAEKIISGGIGKQKTLED